jgi:hypothetical protein
MLKRKLVLTSIILTFGIAIVLASEMKVVLAQEYEAYIVS